MYIVHTALVLIDNDRERHLCENRWLSFYIMVGFHDCLYKFSQVAQPNVHDVYPQSKELVRGPPELVEHFRL